MRDIFIFESPFGIAGKLFNFFILKRYMTTLLKWRNIIIEEFAESDQWKRVLEMNNIGK
jgi:hypothetical protein